MKIRSHTRALACGLALGGLVFSGAAAEEKKKTEKEKSKSATAWKVRTGNQPVIVNLQDLEDLDLDIDVDDIEVLTEPIIRIGQELKAIYVGGEDGKPRLVTVPESYVQRKRAYLGVSLTAITEELREHYGAPEDAGVLIARVEEDSPAAKAGIKVGDVITRVGETDIDSPGDVTRALRSLEKGDEVEIEVVRDGRSVKIDAELGETDRAVYDLGWLQEQYGGKGPNAFRYYLDTDAMQESIEQWKRTWDSQAFQERMKRIPALNQQLEERIKELEQRLRDLEQDLEEDGK